MAETPADRQLVIEAEAQLDRWTNEARTEAYAELFEGEDPILSAADRRRLDAIDSALERHGGDGVWGTDRYGIHTAGSGRSDRSMGVVCVFHPRVTTDTVLDGVDDLDDATEERLNAALWRYSERVASLIEADLAAYVRRRQG